MSITDVHALTLMSREEEQENVCDDLQTTMPHDKSQFKIIMGDFNAKVGEGNGQPCMGKLDTDIEMKEEMSLSTLLLSIT